MGEFSIWHWLVVLLVVVLLFGGGKMSSLMGDFAKGIKAFKKNMEDDTAAAPSATLPGPAASGEATTGAAVTALRDTTPAH